MSTEILIPSRPKARQIEAVRRFSRFYTKRLGVLGESLLGSPFPLPEARLVYELAHHDGTTAGELAAELDLDPGYVSRLLRRLESQNVVVKTQSSTDRRAKILSLTAEGQAAFSKLNESSRRQVESMLAELDEVERRRLIEAMGTVERVLGAGSERQAPYILRPHHSGDMGWVVERHGVLYNQEYGWDEEFEALIAEIVASFIRNFDPRRERCWIAEVDGENVGSVFLVRKGDTTAQLRLLLVEPRARGNGIGCRLVEECTRFARQAGYEKIMLWTNDVLVSARRLYEHEGYELVREEPHESFGTELVGQYWELEL